MNKIFKICLILFCILGSSPSFAKDKIVVVIDTGLDITDSRFKSQLCKTGHKDFTGEGITDTHGHGTHVFGSIQKHAPSSGWCAVIIKYWGVNTKNGMQTYRQSMKYLLTLKPDYVNYSGGGPEVDVQELNTIEKLPQTKFIVAVGNDNQDLRWSNDYYPAKYGKKNITVVGAVDSKGNKLRSSNYGLPYIRTELGENVLSTLPCKLVSGLLPVELGCVGYMTGSSMSTAIATGKILKEDLKVVDLYTRLR